MIWFGWVLWHINIVGYLMPNPLYAYIPPVNMQSMYSTAPVDWAGFTLEIIQKAVEARTVNMKELFIRPNNILLTWMRFEYQIFPFGFFVTFWLNSLCDYEPGYSERTISILCEHGLLSP